MIEEIIAVGHPNILGNHKTTIEITKERNLTKRGDCIIALSANKGLLELSKEFKEKAKLGLKITCILMANGVLEEISGYGHPSLSFSHPKDIVIRKSQYICSRTLMIRANKSARDLDRELIKILQNSKTQLRITLEIDV